MGAKGVKRFDKTYRLDNLPKLKSNSFTCNRRIGYTGSLIKRPIKNTLGIFKHFGFIYGFDEQDTLWIIENNSNGVECITFRDYLAGGNQFVIEHNFDPGKCEVIMSRAFEKSQEVYFARENNCEQFVNYCLNGNHESMQVKISEALVNMLISFSEVYIYMSQSPYNSKILDSLNDTRKMLKLERTKEMQDIFDKRKKELKSANKKAKVKAPVRKAPPKKSLKVK